MKIKFFLLACCLFHAREIVAGDPKFPISAIPDSLKKDVNIVVREDKMIYTILSVSQGKLYSYYAVTILNEKGSDFASRTFAYDKLSKITSLSGNVYDASGENIKKLKKSEIYDQSSYDGSLFSDNRFKAIDLSQGSYPYTVEVEYEMEYSYLYGIDGSVFIPGSKASVQNASYQLIYPAELKPRYKTFNLKTKPVEEVTKEGLISLKWSLSNLMPVKYEPYAPEHSFFPEIRVAPSAFEYSGYRGDMSTWESFGKWEAGLLKGRDNISEATKAKLLDITKDLSGNEEKIKAVYEYLQSKTRYVSVQLGIGGLQPFDASVVDQMGYGDCKALSNYMVVMLREIGIKGYYTTINAGSNAADVIMDFPSHQGNHVIVSVPNGKDTLWLECTSQTNPFGFLGSFTGSRKAMLLTENGGVMVNTPRYTSKTNTTMRTADVTVEQTGDAKAIVKTVYAGVSYESVVLNNADEQKKWIQNSVDIPSLSSVNSFSVVERKAKIPSATVDLDLTLKRFATISGKRVFITPNLMNRIKFIPDKVEKRRTSVVKKAAFTDVDSITYNLPEDVYPEFLPEPTTIKSIFGEYQVRYKIEQGKFIYVRKLRMDRGVFAPEAYDELIEFYKKITKADNNKIVFVSKT
jgi:transglutaminase-like putative cysteine protease